MYIESQIGGQQLNMRQFQIMSLMPPPQIVDLFYEEIYYLYNKTQIIFNSSFLFFSDHFSKIVHWGPLNNICCSLGTKPDLIGGSGQ